MPSYKAIICDLFNTLVSVGEVPLSVGRFTADVLGVDAEDWNDACFGPLHEICEPTRHADVLQALARSIAPDISSERIRQATLERQARFDHALSNVQDSTLETLAALRGQGLQLVLVSNASTGEVMAWPDSPLAPLFDHALFSCECGYKKPDPAIYQLALDSIGLDARDCIYVGDGGSHEFRGANQIGMHTVLTREFLAPRRYQRVLDEQAALIRTEIGRLSELLRLVNGYT